MKTKDLAPPAEDMASPTEDVALPVEDVASPTEDVAGPIEEMASLVEDVAAPDPDDEPYGDQDSLQWEATRLSEFKKENVKRGNQTPCPACAMYVNIKANKCPHCSSDIAANNALVRESLRRLAEITTELEAMRDEHMERFRDVPRPPFSERFKGFFVDRQTHEDMKVVLPSLFLLFAAIAVFRLMGSQPLFWTGAIVGGAIVYALFDRLRIKRLMTIDLYRTMLVLGLLAVMASAFAQPASWWSGARADRVEVLGATINIRTSDTTQSAVLATAHQGDRLTVLERRNNWYKVETRDGQEGWVYSSLVE